MSNKKKKKRKKIGNTRGKIYKNIFILIGFYIIIKMEAIDNFELELFIALLVIWEQPTTLLDLLISKTFGS